MGTMVRGEKHFSEPLYSGTLPLIKAGAKTLFN